MENYTLIVMDSSMGRVFTTTIQKPKDDDFEEYVYDKLEALGFRFKDCLWMEFEGEVENLEIN